MDGPVRNAPPLPLQGRGACLPLVLFAPGLGRFRAGYASEVFSRPYFWSLSRSVLRLMPSTSAARER